MRLTYRAWVVVGVMFGSLVGCGGGATEGNATGGSGSGGAAGTVGAAGSVASGGSTSGGSTSGGSTTGGSNSGGAGGGSANPGGPCTGTYGALAPVVLEDMNIAINGISLTADELELYYARSDLTLVDAPRQIVRRTRASKSAMFGEPEILADLSGVCAADHPLVNPDISDDGLSLYVTCTQQAEPGMPEGVSPLRVARREARGGAFTLAPDPIGSVFASAGISADELTAYTDGEIFETPPRMFTRASKNESFGQPQPVPGVDVGLRSLDISSDGLALFGGGSSSVGLSSVVMRAVRADDEAAFSAPAPLELGLMPMSGVGAPNVTADCSLYAVVVLPNGGGFTVQRALMQ